MKGYIKTLGPRDIRYYSAKIYLLKASERMLKKKTRGWEEFIFCWQWKPDPQKVKDHNKTTALQQAPHYDHHRLVVPRKPHSRQQLLRINQLHPLPSQFRVPGQELVCHFTYRSNLRKTLKPQVASSSILGASITFVNFSPTEKSSTESEPTRFEEQSARRSIAGSS